MCFTQVYIPIYTRLHVHCSDQVTKLFRQINRNKLGIMSTYAQINNRKFLTLPFGMKVNC